MNFGSLEWKIDYRPSNLTDKSQELFTDHLYTIILYHVVNTSKRQQNTKFPFPKIIILEIRGHSRKVLHGALWWLFEKTLKLITGPLKTRARLWIFCFLCRFKNETKKDKAISTFQSQFENCWLRQSLQSPTCSVCSMALGKFLRVQIGMDFSGGSWLEL